MSAQAAHPAGPVSGLCSRVNPPCFTGRPVPTTVNDLLTDIRHGVDGAHREAIACLKRIDPADKDRRTALKAQLPAALFNGRFRPRARRAKANMMHGSGVVFVDIDNVEPTAVIEALTRAGSVLAAWRSPSYTGVHALVQVVPTPENHRTHRDAYRAVVAALNREHPALVIDTAAQDCSRLAFLSFDPDLAWGSHHAPVGWTSAPCEDMSAQTLKAPGVPGADGAAPGPSQDPEDRRLWHALLRKVANTTEGARNVTLNKAAFSLGGLYSAGRLPCSWEQAVTDLHQVALRMTPPMEHEEIAQVLRPEGALLEGRRHPFSPSGGRLTLPERDARLVHGRFEVPPGPKAQRYDWSRWHRSARPRWDNVAEGCAVLRWLLDLGKVPEGIVRFPLLPLLAACEGDPFERAREVLGSGRHAETLGGAMHAMNQRLRAVKNWSSCGALRAQTDRHTTADVKSLCRGCPQEKCKRIGSPLHFAL